MKNNQRKNKKSLVLVAMILMIGLVAGMGAMTYSRYITTTDVPAQTATAAKWGFTITTNVEKLFGTNYSGTGLAVKVQENGTSVHATTSDGNIVAPGTTGSMTVTIAGQAEVLAKVSFTNGPAEESDISCPDYNPIKWNVTKKVGDDTTVVGSADMTLAEMIAALTANTNTSTIAPTDTVSIVYTITWKWDFNNGANDDKDTLIGFAANDKAYDDIKDLKGATGAAYKTLIDADEYDDISYTLSFDFAVTVEQVQADA